MALTAPTPLLRVEEIQGRGRGMVASQPLKAGQVVLRDSPILLYSALPLIPQSSSTSSSPGFCDHCFRTLPGPSSMGSPSSSSVLCPSCCHHRFCNQKCLSIAQNTSHTSWVCQALSHLRGNSVLLGQPLDCQVQAHFLVAAYNLANVSPMDFQTLLSLQGSPDDTTIAVAQFLHSLIPSLSPFAPTSHQNGFSLELTAALLAKDKLNAFGLMQPFSEDNDHRSVRAYCIYPYASFFNHDCLPNACRFDYVDNSATDDNRNTDIIIRMIHDVPEGREVCLSYFPVNENYSSRQKRLAEDYGFTCKCDRCNVEANWSDNDSGGDDDAENIEEEAMDEDDCENMAASDTESNPQGDNSDFPHTESNPQGDDSDFPHAYFFLKFMCDRKNCWGTLAPLPPHGNTPSNVMECNVCGNLKSDNVHDGDGGQDGVSMEG